MDDLYLPSNLDDLYPSVEAYTTSKQVHQLLMREFRKCEFFTVVTDFLRGSNMTWRIHHIDLLSSAKDMIKSELLMRLKTFLHSYSYVFEMDALDIPLNLSAPFIIIFRKYQI